MLDTKSLAAAHRRVVITAKELPLCCPLPDERIWDAHPRIYLPIQETGEAVCPYCGTHFILRTSS